MAIIFTFLSMLMTCGSDLSEKKSVSFSTEEVMKTLVWYGIFNLILFCVLLFVGMDETSLMPHELIWAKPVVLLPPMLNFTFLFFSLVAYKYVGVSVRNTFANTDGVFFVLLMVIYNLITDKAQYITRLFNPLAICSLMLVIGGSLIYPHVKGLREEDGTPDAVGERLSKRILIRGIVISLVAAFFDGVESMASSVIIGDEIADSLDYMCALSLMQAIFAFLVWIYLGIKNKKIYNPFRKTEKYRFICQFCGLASDIFYIFALSDDALLGVILWNAFPIMDIIGARIMMKEKLSVPQYYVLGMTILGAVLISFA